MADLIEFNVTNLTYALIATNILWYWVMSNVRKIIGPTYFDSVVVAIRRGFKKPATFIKFFKSQYYELEIRDTTLSPSFDKAKKIPIKIDESKRLNHEGPYKAYALAQGQTSNINPVDTDQKLYENIQRIGLVNNYVLDVEKERMRKQFENDILTKKHFNLGIALVVVAVLGVGVLVYNIAQFADVASKQITALQPYINSLTASLPHIEPTQQGIIEQITGVKQP